ncbi:MAG: DUF2207 family protein [Candidatus Bilamarchaeaceae archaeon]
MKKLAVLLILLGLAFPFSIDEYTSHASVDNAGNLLVSERIVFDIDQDTYSNSHEGYRSIRYADYDGNLDNVQVRSVRVNGGNVPYAVSRNGENAEIVWKKLYPGRNVVELEYVLKDRAALYDDYAKVCFENYGANWPVPAKRLTTEMRFPSEARDKAVQFEIYSKKVGTARFANDSVVAELDDVPSGNYVGGCYLYSKGALSTDRVMNGSAYSMLKDERKAYGSREMVKAQTPWGTLLCCGPALLILAVLAGYTMLTRKRPPKIASSVLPPDDKEMPVYVSALLRSRYDEKEVFSAVLLQLISKGIIDIQELDTGKGASADRRRTVLFLKKPDAKLTDEEKAVIEIVFGGSKEVDLDQKAKDLGKIGNMADAKKSGIEKSMDSFRSALKAGLKEKGMNPDSLYPVDGFRGLTITVLALGAFYGLAFAFPLLGDSLGYQSDTGDSGPLMVFGIFALIAAVLVYYLITKLMEPLVKKGKEDEFLKWEAFQNGLKEGRIKEYPPASAVIWGNILAYAAVLGLADTVNRNLSELKTILPGQAMRMNRVRLVSYTYYNSTIGVYGLSRYGDRSSGGQYGNFSSHSSGGWSGGGGGFSGGHSGGGGFR